MKKVIIKEDENKIYYFDKNSSPNKIYKKNSSFYKILIYSGLCLATIILFILIK